MFKDTKEELERLEAELLEEDTEEVTEEETAEEGNDDELLEEIIQQVKDVQDMDATQAFYRNVHGMTSGQDATRRIDASRLEEIPPKIYNSDRMDGNIQTYSNEIYEDSPQNGITGLVVTASLLSAGILAVVIWWIVRYWGVL